MAKSPEEMASSMIKNLEQKTGTSMAGWLKIAKKAALEKHGQLVKHLKVEHGIGHGYANLIAHTHFQSAAASSDAGDLIDTQYAGPKAELRPIYEAIVKAARKFGADVEISPKKAYVSLRRSKQFALIQPSTKTRVDVGLNLKGAKPTARLEVSGSFNSMCSHRVRTSSVADVDAELLGWLQLAYEDA